MPFFHLYTLIEGLMLIWFYQKLFSDDKRKLFVYVQIIFGVACIINALFVQGLYLYASYTRYAESIICILFALKYFAQIAQLEVRPLKMPGFYFNTGIFLYFSGSFILFIFSNLILQKLPASTMLIFWTGHSILVLLMYVLFSIGFIKCKK
jgi:hypothetical protein